jgi:hypothetical protein
MALHKDLTGAELHEPKGVASASSGQVYIANGSGSGAWTSKNSDILNVNKFYLSGRINDIGTASDRCFFYLPIKCSLSSFAAVIHNAITTTNTIISVYIGGVLFADTLTVNFTGSTVGSSFNKNVTTSNTIPSGTVVEFRSDGATDAVVKADITAVFTAIP